MMKDSADLGFDGDPPNTTVPVTVDALRVEVHVLRVGGNKLTKQMFTQIPYANYSAVYDLHQDQFLRGADSGIQILGYVLEYLTYGEILRTIILTYNGRLLRMKVPESDNAEWFTKTQIYIGA